MRVAHKVVFGSGRGVGGFRGANQHLAGPYNRPWSRKQCNCKYPMILGGLVPESQLPQAKPQTRSAACLVARLAGCSGLCIPILLRHRRWAATSLAKHGQLRRQPPSVQGVASLLDLWSPGRGNARQHGQATQDVTFSPHFPPRVLGLPAALQKDGARDRAHDDRDDKNLVRAGSS